MKDVLVVVCTPDLRRESARRCIESVRATDLGRAELLVVDNAFDPAFHHAATMEQIRVLAGDRPVVFLDDDVEIDTPDWLARLFATRDATDALVVGCRHRSPGGEPNHVGALVFEDGSTEILCERPAAAGPGPFVPAVSSAVVLLPEPSRVAFDLRFAKYQHDLDLGMQAWRQGRRVACCDELEVVHVMGGYAMSRPEVFNRFWPDAFAFRDKWAAFAAGGLYDRPELAGFAASARGTNWLVLYNHASSVQRSDPDAARRAFWRIARECPTPERAAGAYFHLYEIDGDPVCLEACLEREPAHRKARELLELHRREDTQCATSRPSSSRSESPLGATSSPPPSSGWARSPST